MSTIAFPDDDLPTYESIMKEVRDYTSEQNVALHATSFLLQAHGDVIESEKTAAVNTESNKIDPQMDFSFLTEAEKEKLSLEIAKLLSSEKGQAIMRMVAKKINTGISEAKSMFLTLYGKLTEVDDSGKSSKKFAADILKFKAEFETAVTKSRDLARKIADYAEAFEDFVLPLYENKSIQPEKKQELIRDYIKEADGFATESEAQQKSFDDLKIRFKDFVDSFRNFAAAEETAFSAELQKLKDELVELQEKLGKAYENVGLSFAAGFGTGIVGAVFLGLIFPAALPAILVGGAVVAGLGSIVGIGFGIYAETLESKVTEKKKEIADKEAQLTQIKKTREELTRLGERDFELFSRNVQSLILVWESARSNALSVISALGRGEKAVALKLDPGLKIQLNKSVNLYKSVSYYLRGYANGIMQ